MDLRGNMTDSETQFLPLASFIGSFVISLINSKRCECKSTATVGARLIQHAFYAYLVQKVCKIPRWRSQSKYIKTFRKVFARGESQRIRTFFTAF